MPRKKVGESIRWMYRAAGTYRARRGRVVAVVEANENARDRLRELRGVVPRCRATFGDRSSKVRYLVEVQQVGQGGDLREPLFFAVLVSKIDAQLAAEALEAILHD